MCIRLETMLGILHKSICLENSSYNTHGYAMDYWPDNKQEKAVKEKARLGRYDDYKDELYLIEDKIAYIELKNLSKHDRDIVDTINDTVNNPKKKEKKCEKISLKPLMKFEAQARQSITKMERKDPKSPKK